MRKLILLIFFICSGQAFAYSEINADFGYNRLYYGANRENTIINRSYSGTFATYFSENFAVEFNYSRTQQITTEITNLFFAGPVDYYLTGSQNRVTNIVYGAGIRWLLTSRQSRIRPHISMGYANQEVQNASDETYFVPSSNETFTFTSAVTRQRIKSVYGALALQFGITQHFAIKGSVQTVFEAFKTERAKDNIKYMAGLTWIF